MISPKIYSVLFLALAVNLGQANLLDSCSPAPECNATTPVACRATSCPNHTFFSPANSELSEGTYIAASLAGALQLMSYLDAHPTINVTNLLISDSTIEDLATDFGYGETRYEFLDRDKKTGKPKVDNRPINRNISRTLRQTILDLDAVSSRIMDRTPDNRIRNVLDRDFPRLTHLTLRDREWSFQNLPGRRTFLRSVPSLTHLHVVSNPYPRTETLLPVVRQSVPNATHIRFSGNFPKEFSKTPMFLVQWARALVDGFARSTPPIVIVQPDFSPDLHRGRKCGNPGIEYDCLLSRLARNNDMHLGLPPPEDFGKYGDTYESSRLFPLSRAIAEFEDRLLGGEGEWAVPSKNDTLEYAQSSLRYCSGY
ncbi:hypothetical protein B0H14DRAFT_2881159 [Mycena olivaceomarginata]|nr:hypothetical protein B0H14DRAFT_2881159 [Mycena olivaceomarginata]